MYFEFLFALIPSSNYTKHLLYGKRRDNFLLENEGRLLLQVNGTVVMFLVRDKMTLCSKALCYSLPEKFQVSDQLQKFKWELCSFLWIS